MGRVDRLTPFRLTSSMLLTGPFFIFLESPGIFGSSLGAVGCQLQVQVRGSPSAPFEATSRIPQTSYHGPLCFLLMINDVVESLPSGIECLPFADVMKLLGQVRCVFDSELLQTASGCVKS